MSQTPEETTPFIEEIRAFEKQDAHAFPPRDGVLFIGSSSIALWKHAQRDFPFAEIIRRGFGGSQIEDSIRYAPRIVVPYAPRLVLFYAGDNDLASGKTPERVLADFQAFEELVHAHLPSTQLAFVSIKYSPSRWSLKNQIAQANELVKAHCEARAYLSFVDIAPVTLNEDGTPKRKLFIEDGLHPSLAGYAAWTTVLAPFIKNHRTYAKVI